MYGACVVATATNENNYFVGAEFNISFRVLAVLLNTEHDVRQVLLLHLRLG